MNGGFLFSKEIIRISKRTLQKDCTLCPKSSLNARTEIYSYRTCFIIPHVTFWSWAFCVLLLSSHNRHIHVKPSDHTKKKTVASGRRKWVPPETNRLSARLIICKTSRLGIVRDTQKLCQLGTCGIATRESKGFGALLWLWGC